MSIKKQKRLLILGAGGHGDVTKEIAEACGWKTAFLDDSNPKAIGCISDLERLLPSFDSCFIAIGNADMRAELTKRVEELMCNMPILIHPAAYVSPSAQIGVGTVVAPHAVINSNVRIGKGCIVSILAAVDHDVTIGDFCHVNSGAICMAGTHLDNREKLDAGEVLKQ